MKQIALLLTIILMSGCAYNTTLGENGRYKVYSIAQAAAPSVTIVEDSKHVDAFPQVFAGPSLLGQTMQAAGNVAAGALIGNGLSKNHGTSVNQTNNGGQGGSGGSGGNGVGFGGVGVASSVSDVRSNLTSQTSVNNTAVSGSSATINSGSIRHND